MNCLLRGEGKWEFTIREPLHVNSYPYFYLAADES